MRNNTCSAFVGVVMITAIPDVSNCGRLAVKLDWERIYPALPSIWMMSSSEYSMNDPLYCRVPLIITICAGKLIPTARVDVVPRISNQIHPRSMLHITLMWPSKNPLSTNIRSVLDNDPEWNATPCSTQFASFFDSILFLKLFNCWCCCLELMNMVGDPLKGTSDLIK